MWCPNCGKEIADDAAFCGYCGRKIENGISMDWGHEEWDFESDPFYDNDDGFTENDNTGTGPKKSGGAKWAVIIGIIAAVVVFAVLGTWMLLSSGSNDSDDEDQLTETDDLDNTTIIEDVSDTGLIEEEAEEGADATADLAIEEPTASQLYYDKLMELQETYGEAVLDSEIDPYGSGSEQYYWWEGLFYADLLDFDGDGQEELITAVCSGAQTGTGTSERYCIQVWGIIDSDLEEVYSSAAFMFYDSGVGCEMELIDGIWYLLDGFWSGAGELNEYYRYTDGSFVLAKSFDIYGTSSGYIVDGAEVSYEEWSSAWTEWNVQLTQRNTICFGWSEAYAEMDGTTTVDILEETLAELSESLGLTADSVYDQEQSDDADWADWAAAYLNLLDEISVHEETALTYEEWYEYACDGETGSYTGFSLIYVDDDEIPELVMHGLYENSGMLIFTVDEDGSVNGLLSERRASFSYAEQGNLLVSHSGVSGYYWDRIYAIEDGDWALLAEGEYSRDEADPSGDSYLYRWDGSELSEEEYQSALSRYTDGVTLTNSTIDGDYTLSELQDFLSAQ